MGMGWHIKKARLDVTVPSPTVQRITGNITHPPKKKQKVTVAYKCGTRLKTNKCTGERVKLGLKLGRYCGMCY